MSADLGAPEPSLQAQLNRTARQFLLAPSPCIFRSIDRAHRWYPNQNCNRSGTISTSIEEGLMQSIAADAICGDPNVFNDQTLIGLCLDQPGIGMLHNQAGLRRLSHPNQPATKKMGFIVLVPPGDECHNTHQPPIQGSKVDQLFACSGWESV